MEFKEYQEQTMKFQVNSELTTTLIYPALGIAGEAGEVAEKVKKIIRDKKNITLQEDKEAIKKELGDVLFYVTAMSIAIGSSLEDVASTNVKKLADRHTRSVVHGDGDDR